MAERSFWIAVSPESATCLWGQYTCEGHPGCLATFSSRHCRQCLPNKEDNIIAVLERSDCVCQIDLRGNSFSPMEDVMAAMQQPFPELTDLVIKMPFGTATDLPDSFLSGSSPRLRRLKLCGIPFPGLPNLLLSTTRLVDLHLCCIPQSGYISPEVMATALSTLTSLHSIDLKYLFFRSRPDPASQPPPTRSLLPVLETLSFEGVTVYLDDLVARIDAPRLNDLCVAFFDQFVSDTPQFTQLISRTSAFEVLETVHVAFEVDGAVVKLSSETSGFARLSVKISCGELHEQLSSLEQVLTLCLPPVSTAASEDLYIYENIHSDWPDYIEDTLLGLLRPFTAVMNLYLCEDIAPHIALALQGLVGDRTTEVLPALESIFLEGLQPQGPMQKGIRMFIAARQLSDHPVAVFPFSERERYMEMRNLDLEFDE